MSNPRLTSESPSPPDVPRPFPFSTAWFGLPMWKSCGLAVNRALPLQNFLLSTWPDRSTLKGGRFCNRRFSDFAGTCGAFPKVYKVYKGGHPTCPHPKNSSFAWRISQHSADFSQSPRLILQANDEFFEIGRAHV